jgi:hypothetical protein
LDKFRLAGVTFFYAFDECIEIDMIRNSHWYPPYQALLKMRPSHRRGLRNESRPLF